MSGSFHKVGDDAGDEDKQERDGSEQESGARHARVGYAESDEEKPSSSGAVLPK